MSEFLHKLSDVQRKAAENFQGPSLIVAGAGSGKTRVLTYRIAHMLEQGVAPYNILALTFTNKAASEMRERIGQIVSESRARHLWMGTFHSVFARILRSEADKLGYPSSFTIYDTADSKNVVKAVIKELNLSDETYKVNEVFSRISLAKNNLVTATSYESNTSLMAEDRERRRPLFHQVYKRYVQKCKEYGAMDFDDLLLNMNILFRDFPETLAKYQNQFRYLLVDEYQDTNMAQYLIIKRIAEQFKNICVVGDDAQSIYSFRGAKIENILRFQKDYPEAKVFKLEQNYRSTQNIVNAANRVIGFNQKQIRKKSFSAKNEGEKIQVFKAYTDQEEGLMVVNDMYSRIREKQLQYNDVAVLYRTNAQSRVLEEALRTRNIPYKIYGGQSFYQRKEIKDILGYIRLVVNHKDDEAFRRIINYPARGIGDVTVSKIANTAAAHNVSMWEVISRLTPEQMGLRGAAGKKIGEFHEMIQELSSDVYTMPAYELGLKIATRSGIIGSFRMQQTPEAVSVLENIEELLNSIASFTEMYLNDSGDGIPPTIDMWLQNVSLLTDMDNEKDTEKNRVTLMTVHSAKGLEFPHVYIVGLEETLFPSQMCMDSQEGLEEERRLFYVALTRAKEEAVLTFAISRFRWGNITQNRPSRFIREIGSDYLDPQYSEDPTFELPHAGSGFGRQEIGENGRAQFRRRTEDEIRRNNGTGRNAVTQRPNAIPVEASANLKSIGRRAETESGTSFAGSIGQSVTLNKLVVGNRVEHDKFGQGTVTVVEETNHGTKATVNFERHGIKTLLLKYARLRLIG